MFDYIEQMRKMLPADHPANEEPLLTPLQQFAFPVLMWFFDLERNRATGRSYLMAVVCIELALRGEKVYIEDLSRSLTQGNRPEMYRYFLDILNNVLQTKYKRHIFQINMQNKILEYKGKRPK